MKFEHLKTLADGYEFYEFTPSIRHLMYIAIHPMNIKRKIRLLGEHLHKGSYKVYYLEVHGALVGYCLIAPGGRRLKCSTPNDIVVGPYYVKKDERGKGYSKIILRTALDYCSYQYKNAFDYIKKTNLPSIKTSEACGFKTCGELNNVGILHRLVEHPNGEYLIYKKEKEENHG